MTLQSGYRPWIVLYAIRRFHCTECKEPFYEGKTGATHFICPNCNTPDLEWKALSSRKKDLKYEKI